jgi:hypothetical protein
MCNALTNVAAPVVPTCTTGTLPTGAGGTVADGTYVLSAQTYYNLPGCGVERVAATFSIAGGCVQLVAGADTAAGGGLVSFSGTATVTTQGNEMTVDVTCPSVPPGHPDTPVRTYTATGSTLTWFIRNSAAGNPNPDRVEVYTKQ